MFFVCIHPLVYFTWLACNWVHQFTTNPVRKRCCCGPFLNSAMIGCVNKNSIVTLPLPKRVFLGDSSHKLKDAVLASPRTGPTEDRLHRGQAPPRTSLTSLVQTQLYLLFTMEVGVLDGNGPFLLESSSSQLSAFADIRFEWIVSLRTINLCVYVNVVHRLCICLKSNSSNVTISVCSVSSFSLTGTLSESLLCICAWAINSLSLSLVFVQSVAHCCIGEHSNCSMFQSLRVRYVFGRNRPSLLSTMLIPSWIEFGNINPISKTKDFQPYLQSKGF